MEVLRQFPARGGDTFGNGGHESWIAHVIHVPGAKRGVMESARHTRRTAQNRTNVCIGNMRYGITIWRMTCTGGAGIRRSNVSGTDGGKYERGVPL